MLLLAKPRLRRTNQCGVLAEESLPGFHVKMSFADIFEAMFLRFIRP